MTRPDDDYLWDRQGPADPDVARLEQLLAPLAHDAPLDERRRRRRRRWPIAAIGAAVAAAAAVAIVWWRWPDPQPVIACTNGFAFTRGGTERGVLCVGSVLDTGAHEAELAIANIGKAELGAGTRVRLDQTSAERHELYLERGRLHARVDAPPRLFAVATPSANVTDLGCEYTLAVDASGAGTITVQSGKVELATGTAGAVVVAPMRTHARLLPGRRPGLPVVDGAGQALEAAVAAFERGAADGIDRVMAAATPTDALTVANLAELVPPAQKRRVLDRLAQLSAPPQELSVDDVLADHALYEMWFDDVILQHLTNIP
jgi:ferric-dicitrate binding protein FerR (iron transport regulator)